MADVPSNSVNLVVTSPPYPMIEMWDEQFSSDRRIKDAIISGDGARAFALMHKALDRTWAEVKRVTAPGGLACINIGDATRKLGESFRLYTNHSRVTRKFEEMGFHSLPAILWQKTTTKPNKYMGSGMFPTNAYVTLEHEYVLIFRKGDNRIFDEKCRKSRYRSAYFWEERNKWFSDVWNDLRCAPQQMHEEKLRARSAAYPFELAYRLINMYSIVGDTVLDPFCGTGTTAQAAIASGRNSIGYEVDRNFRKIIMKNINDSAALSKKVARGRLREHAKFMSTRKKGVKKHVSINYGFEVVTAQEEQILLPIVEKILRKSENEFEAYYEEITQI